MPADFPTLPSVNQIYTYQGKSWQWNGYAWDIYPVDSNAVTYLNGFTGNVTIAGGTEINIENSLNTITVSYTGTGGGGGICGPYVISFNGLTGAVTGVTTGISNIFVPLQNFTNGISSNGGTFSSQTRFISGISVTGGATFNNTDISVNSITVGRGGGNVTSNTVVGSQSLRSNTIGTQNVAIGIQTLDSNVTGSNNSAIGRRCLNALSNGGGNVAFGGNAFSSLTTSNNCVAVGANSASSIFTGTGCIYIGFGADSNSSSTENEIVIGTNVVGLGSNTTVIGPNTQVSTTIRGLVNAPNGFSGSGATILGNINLENSEFIRNTTNGRMDFMPSPIGSGNFGLYTDFTSWGFGVKIGTIRSSDQALNAGAFLFDTDCTLLGSKFFAMEPGQTIKFLASGPDSNNNNTLQCTINQQAGRTGNAFVLMDSTATGYGSTRVPNQYFSNPNFFIYSGTLIRTNANDFIRFEHNLDNGRIISGGTSGINLEPGSGIIGISGGISAAGGITLNSTIISNGYRYSSSVFDTKTSGFTLSSADAGKIFLIGSSGATTNIYCPTGLPVGFQCDVIRRASAGQRIRIFESSTTIESKAGNNPELTNSGNGGEKTTIIQIETNVFVVYGDI